MRTQIHNEHWKWIVWLIILLLLNAIALAAGRGGRGGDRSSSGSAQRAQTQQSSSSDRTEVRSTPQSAPASVSRTERREVASSPAPQTAARQSPSPASTPVRSSRSASVQSQRQVVSSSRSVNHEVIIAPSSQSLNVSSSQTAASITAPRAERTGRGRTVEVIPVQSEQSVSSVVSTVQPTRRDRIIETIQVPADTSKTSRQQDMTLDSNRESRGRTQRTSQPQAKEGGTVPTSSITTTDTAKSQETVVSAASGDKSDTKASDRSGSSRNTRASTVIRHDAKQSENRKAEPVVVKNEDIKVEPQRSRPSRSEGQRPDKNDQTLKLQDRSRTPSVIASRTDGIEKAQRGDNSESPDRRPDNRWSRLRSKINDQSDFDRRSRDGRPDRDNHIRPDENRGRVVISNNNIHVERGDRDSRYRPYVSRHLISDIRPIRNDHRWRPCGSSFIFSWSNYSCGRVILAPYHDYYGISYYYPSYHRKYLFVSLGGYWPYSYRYQRYYWYGCHPYYWYGSYVVSSPDTVVYDYTTTYNYYTAPTITTVAPTAATTGPVEEPAATDTPLPQTQADICFANAVNAFEEGRYENAVELFRQAVLMSPEDEIIPFTYTQALFASGDYALAAYVLREIMAKMPTDEPAVYFPRGLYKDDQILITQISSLESAIAIEPFSTDYQLLLGYQCMGLGQWDKAVNALEQAARNPLNAGVVNKLLDIAEKMENDVQQNAATLPQI